MTDKNIAIRVSHLGKKYSIGGPQEKYLTFRDAIVNSVKAPFRRFYIAFTSSGRVLGAEGRVVRWGAGRGCRDYRAERCREVDAAEDFVADNFAFGRDG
jgi:hypothetical protein